MKTGRIGPTLIGTDTDPLEKRLAFHLENPDEVWPLLILEKNWLANIALLSDELNLRAQVKKKSKRPFTSFTDDELRSWIAQTRRLVDSFDVPGQYPDTREQLRRIADGFEHALNHEPAILCRSRYPGPVSVLKRRFNLFFWGWEQMRWLFNSSYTNPPIFPSKARFWTTTLQPLSPDRIILDIEPILKRIQRMHGRMSRKDRAEAFVWFLQALRLGPVKIDGSSSLDQA